jgi:hypothetical protein
MVAKLPLTCPTERLMKKYVDIDTIAGMIVRGLGSKLQTGVIKKIDIDHLTSELEDLTERDFWKKKFQKELGKETAKKHIK